MRLMNDELALSRAAEAVAAADALLIGAGAGMGVDSGLPDFRGSQGFWRAYPPYRALGLDFVSVANPRWFIEDPTLAWGFYGHRLNLYRATAPHAGFQILRSWSERMRQGAFVFTSNVDGHFQRAGFEPERIVEYHGTIHALQCTRPCGIGVFSAAATEVRVDEATFRACEPLPRCPACGSLARPNILMFADWQWDNQQTTAALMRLEAWLATLAGQRLVVVECGAGTAIPTVRETCASVAASLAGTLIRINLHEPAVPPGGIRIACGALDALSAMQSRLVG